VFSDIPNNEILRWSEEDGHVDRRFHFPSGNADGNTFDHQGQQISFCHGTRNVTGVSHYPTAKSVIWVYDVDGKRLRNAKVLPR